MEFTKDLSSFRILSKWWSTKWTRQAQNPLYSFMWYTGGIWLLAPHSLEDPVSSVPLKYCQNCDPPSDIARVIGNPYMLSASSSTELPVLLDYNRPLPYFLISESVPRIFRRSQYSVSSMWANEPWPKSKSSMVSFRIGEGTAASPTFTQRNSKERIHTLQFLFPCSHTAYQTHALF